MMKKRAPRATRVAIFMLLCTVFILTACAKAEYQKDVKVKEIATILCEKISPASAWVGEDEEVIEEYVPVPDYVKESQIYYAQNTNDLDEFGILWVEEGQAKAVKSLLMHGYLEKRYTENREWYDSYMPNETPKLRDAEVRVYGNCVAYAILSPERRTAFFSECEKLLKS